MSARCRGAVAANAGWAATAASSAARPSAGCVGHRAQRLTGRGVHDVERASVRSVQPFAVDEESLVDSLDNFCLVVLVH
jgi:hypothetical protein